MRQDKMLPGSTSDLSVALPQKPTGHPVGKNLRGNMSKVKADKFIAPAVFVCPKMYHYR